MIKKLIEKIKTRKEFEEIKKHYRIAKRHRSKQELIEVSNELLKFRDKTVQNNQMDQNLYISIRCLFESIDYVKTYQHTI